VAKYLKRLAEEGGKKLDKKESRFRLHLIPFFRDTSLLRVSSFQVERYKKSRVDAGVKEGTVNRELAALSHLFTTAEEWGSESPDLSIYCHRS
jgi:hypothetical protein